MRATCPFSRRLTVAICQAELGHWQRALRTLEWLLDQDPGELLSPELLGEAMALRGALLLRLARPLEAFRALTQPEALWACGALRPDEQQAWSACAARAGLAAGVMEDQVAA